MELSILILGEISQSLKDKYCMFSFICEIWVERKDMKVKE
jgi:hypothetical protein